MPKFAVFFSDGAGFGIEMVQALDAAHAQDISKARKAWGPPPWPAVRWSTFAVVLSLAEEGAAGG